MKPRHIVLAILVAALALPLAIDSVTAADAQNRYKLRGLGALECSKYLEDRRTDLKGSQSYADWFTGYLTAYNYMTADTYDIAPNHDANALLTYLDLYCAKNQKTKIGLAVAQFVKAVHDKRQTTAK